MSTLWLACGSDPAAPSYEEHLCFHCPGCGYGHSFRVKSNAGLPVWTWNQDMLKPTFSPSLLVNGRWPEKTCHLFLRDGLLEFLGDCHHDLKGQTVPLPDDV